MHRARRRKVNALDKALDQDDGNCRSNKLSRGDVEPMSGLAVQLLTLGAELLGNIGVALVPIAVRR